MSDAEQSKSSSKKEEKKVASTTAAPVTVDMISSGIDYEKAIKNILAHSSYFTASSGLLSHAANLASSGTSSYLSALTGLGYGKASAEATQLEEQINTLRKEIREKTQSLESHRENAAQFKKTAGELETGLKALKQKEELAFLLSRVSTEAQDRLLTDEAFRKRFFENTECSAFVISVDIRRSTELMLKARSAAKFSKFITELCEYFDGIIKSNFGVFDKFTGDGVLAFFPEFFSGKDAGYYALRSAQLCQEAFASVYKAHRTSFTTVITDIGLGIGVDYGLVHLLRMGGGLTVVGGPVVYACRLGGAPAGHTYLNQPAFEQVSGAYGASLYCSETALEIKHEGRVLCYDVTLARTEFIPQPPDWISKK